LSGSLSEPKKMEDEEERAKKLGRTGRALATVFLPMQLPDEQDAADGGLLPLLREFLGEETASSVEDECNIFGRLTVARSTEEFDGAQDGAQVPERFGKKETGSPVETAATLLSEAANRTPAEHAVFNAAKRFAALHPGGGAQPSGAEIATAIRGLEHGEELGIHVEAQNCALLIRRETDTATLAAWQLVFPGNVLIGENKPPVQVLPTVVVRVAWRKVTLPSFAEIVAGLCVERAEATGDGAGSPKYLGFGCRQSIRSSTSKNGRSCGPTISVSFASADSLSLSN